MLFFATLSRCEDAPIPLKPEGGYVHFLSANDEDWEEKFQVSKLQNISGPWHVQEEAVPQAISGEKMFFMMNESKYYGASTKFESPLKLKDQTLVVQYEVRLQEELVCGGAYLKLFSDENYVPEEVSNETKYSIMFGPDKCGSTNKVHFIFRHKNPKTGVIEEKHMKDAPSIKSDKINHLYTLIVRPDNSFEVLIDTESVKQGNLLTDFAPSVNPPKMIDDPTDKKPEDWVDDEKIPDPEAKKPEDWDEEAPEFIPDPAKKDIPEGWLVDEPKFIPDPEAKKPEDWDDDINGEWEAPTIANPKCEAAPGCGEYEAPLIKNENYKGKWKAPMIDNPAYKGVWKPRQIENPDYFEDNHPHNFMTIAGVGFDLWEVNKMIGFTNIYIGTDEAAVMKWNKDNFIPKHAKQEAEQKKLEPKESKELGGAVGALSKFVKQVKDAYLNLYEENKVMVIALTALAGAIPLILILLACCKSSPEPEEPKVEEKKVAEEKKEEEDKKEEVAEEPKAEEKKEEEVAEEPKAEEEKKEEEVAEEPKVEEKKEEKKATKRKGNRKADNF
jgi:calnexin